MVHPAPWRTHLGVLVAYTVVTFAFAWPLPVHLATHLTGTPSGDTGVYVWNLWVFQHELLDHRSLPYFTDTIFAMTGRANLSLHNYTTFQNLLALPLVRTLGVVSTFNIIYLLMTLITAYTTFLLAKHVTGRTMESWLAGLLFAWSPVLVTRGMSHFSLVAAAPLAVFLLVLLRTAERERLRDAFALGATVSWAASTDVYYAVYCLMIAAVFLLERTVRVHRSGEPARAKALPWALDVLLLCVAGLVLSLLISGGWQITFLGRVVRVRSLYTPVLVLTALALLRIGWRYRASLVPVERTEIWRSIHLASAVAVMATVLLSPVLYAVGVRIADGRWDSQRIFWRSSPRGIDVLSLVLPNPNHPFAPAAIREWLTPRPDAYFENVASLPFVALAIVLVAWRAGWRFPRLWAVLAVVFGLLALGPFIHVGTVDTYIPGPWAFLRYLPLIGLTRTPARFSIVLMLAFAVLFAVALCWLGQRSPHHRQLLLSGVTALLLFELLPVPRVLYSAAVPRIYRHIAAAPVDVRVLELPFGIRDVTSSAGRFTARSQFYQTVHGKSLLGGYLSRVSRRRLSEIRRYEMLDAFIILSEGQQISAAREAQLVERGPAFTTRAGLGFVVIDRLRTPDALRDFAVRALRLHHVETDGDFELYRPSREAAP